MVDVKELLKKFKKNGLTADIDEDIKKLKRSKPKRSEEELKDTFNWREKRRQKIRERYKK